MSEACCTLPPVQAEYTSKGSFETVAGLKTYKTGPADATTAVILIYDVFGITPQIQQGADMLAASGKHPFQVLIPDFLKGEYAQGSWFGPNAGEEGKKAIGKYFGPDGVGNPGVVTGLLKKVVEEIKGAGTVTKFGAVGYCWGAKIVSINLTEGTAFSVAAEVHPSMMTPEDGSKIVKPIIVLASKDEDAEIVKAFGANLKVPNVVDFYNESPHGWMTTRADLKDEKMAANFAKGYQAVSDFFHEHLSL
ncbi:hypothetical protein BT63DRAFT_458558 [Microthyrium microscopicum]|uniref:Dienelactone hydrolase domain-containing protein n=1 Tax=Microthyrium microscopicum TaxID=703497 RepID=A0A6A6U247_9PEZI|nr:hypothetical protein BT63DRAFT_458558 [Microthyrium microscopicum]